MHIFTSTNLMILWILAGLFCFIPLLVKKWYLRYAVVPFVLAAVYASFVVNNEFIGRARYHLPDKEFVFKSYSVKTIGQEKFITMVITDDFDELLIRFPWTKENQQKLEEAKKRSEKGIAQMGKFKSKKGRSPYEKSDTELQLYDFPYQQLYPKDQK